MAIALTSQVDFRSTKALEVRAQYSTVARMKAMKPVDLNPGLIAYCEDTKKKYEYHPDNAEDPTTGKWREVKTLTPTEFDTLATKQEVNQAKSEASNKYALKTDIKKTTVQSSGLVHTIKYGDETVGTINIPQDLFVQNFEYDSVGKKLKITVNNSTNSGAAKVTEVSVADFVQTYTSGTGLELSGNRFSLTSQYTALPAKVTTLEQKVTTLERRPSYELNHAGGGNKRPVKVEGNKLYVDVEIPALPEKATAAKDGLMSKEHFKRVENIRGFIFAVNPEEYEEKRLAGHLHNNAIYFLDASISRGTTPEAFTR